MNTRLTRDPASYRPAVTTILYLLIGPLAWAAHLTLIYGVQSVACAVAPPRLSPLPADLDGVRWIILVSTVLILAAMAAASVVLPRPVARSENVELSTFLDRVMQLLAVLSAFGIIAAGSAAFTLPTCAGLR